MSVEPFGRGETRYGGVRTRTGAARYTDGSVICYHDRDDNISRNLGKLYSLRRFF